MQLDKPDNTPFNLITSPWIPAKRSSGKIEMITPAQITEDHEHDPFVEVHSPRADLDACYTLFLIGLVQTAMPPKHGTNQWWGWLATPPSPTILREAFEPIRHAFELVGDGPCFMQELGGLEGSEVPITDLFVNAPGDNTRKENRDFFIKRSDELLSEEAAAIALYALQINASGGGNGYHTSIRGGGPLTTLVLGPTLWSTVLANLLDDKEVDLEHGLPKDLSKIFLWLAPTRMSNPKENGVDTTPKDTHHLHHYWSMPWRISLEPRRAPGSPCAIYNERQGVFGSFIKTNHGTNYTGLWKHPLTPYRIKRDKKGTVDFISLKANTRSIRYTNWPQIALVSASTEDFHIAEAVRLLSERRLSGRAEKKKSKPYPWLSKRRTLWLFGYEMDKAKTLQWHDARGPLLIEPDPEDPALAPLARMMIVTAERVEETLYRAIRKVLCQKVIGKNGLNYTWDRAPDNAPTRSSTHVASILEAFWDETTPSFHDTLYEASDLLDAGNDLITDFDPQREAWLTLLHRCAVALFDRQAPSEFAHLRDMRTHAAARSELVQWTSPRGKRLRGEMGLTTL